MLARETLPFGLCCGSLVQADFRGLAEAASAAGFSSISLWPNLYYDALEQGLSTIDLRCILDDNALQVTELDPLMTWLPLDIRASDLAAAFTRFEEDDFYRMADALGARTLNIIQQGEATVSEQQRIGLICGLCERAASHGLEVSIEFLPWSPIGCLGDALELVEAAGRDNLGVNIDIWHHFRSGGTINQLAGVDSTRVSAVQFNDVAANPWEDLLQETALGRLLPGEGATNSAAVFDALCEAGISAPINVEVFSAELMSLSAAEAAKRLAQSMRAVLDQSAHPDYPAVLAPR